MPQTALIYRILVASPSDCVEERHAIQQVVYDWNSAHSLATGTILEPVLWETHAVPEIGDRPQAIINRQLVSHCDLLIGAFWTRLGTNTGVAESGTAEEIERFRESGKRALLYFSSRPVAPDALDMSQYGALKDYKKRLQPQGLYRSYDSLQDFRDQLRVHLAKTASELQHEAVATASSRERIVGAEVYCGATRSYQSLGFDGDLRAVRDAYPMGVTDDCPLTASGLTSRLIARPYHIVHLLGFVNPSNGSLVLDELNGEEMPAHGIRKLVEQCGAKLVFLATCDSLFLASQLAPVANVVAGHGAINSDALVAWERCFYHLLGQGKSVSEAYEVARATSDLPIVLFLKKDVTLLPAAGPAQPGIAADDHLGRFAPSVARR